MNRQLAGNMVYLDACLRNVFENISYCWLHNHQSANHSCCGPGSITQGPRHISCYILTPAYASYDVPNVACTQLFVGNVRSLDAYVHLKVKVTISILPIRTHVKQLSLRLCLVGSPRLSTSLHKVMVLSARGTFRERNLSLTARRNRVSYQFQHSWRWQVCRREAASLDQKEDKCVLVYPKFLFFLYHCALSQLLFPKN